MDIEAYECTGILLEGSKNGHLSEINIFNNRILAYINAIRVEDEDGEKIKILGNTIRMLDKKDGDVAIFIQALDSLIEDNDITVVPADDLTPEVDIPGDDTIPNPTDPCAKLWLIYLYRLFLTSYINGIWAFVMRNFPAKQFNTPGGIQIAGKSERIKIHKNRIVGGYWNGITLGHIPKEVEKALKKYINKYAVDKLPITVLTELQKRLDPFIYNLDIEENDIQYMGLNGIGVVSFFSIRDIALMISVDDMTIYRNNITDCLQQLPLDITAGMSREMAFGGISLADCEDLIIRENRIEDNGIKYPGPVCGIFIQHGEKIDISDNRILNNGPKSVSTNAAVLKGIGGGVVIRWSFKQKMVEILKEKQFFVPDGIPAVKIHENTITQPLGQAILIMAMGPVSVVGNQLTSQGVDSRANPFSMLAGAVLIFNLGVSADLFAMVLLASLSTLFQASIEYTMPLNSLITWGKVLEFLYYLPSGNVLFANNQITLDLRDLEISKPISSQFIFSLDDVSYGGNQAFCAAILDTLLSDALIAGNTVRTNDNRFQEGSTLSLFSLISIGLLMNTCTGNQATHCLNPVGIIKPQKVDNNIVMYESLPFTFGKEINCKFFNDKLIETLKRKKA